MEPPTIDRNHPVLPEVVPSMLAALGVPAFDDTLGLGRVSRGCVLLVDGLGWELLREHAADAPVLSGLSARPLRVGYPSTTAAGVAAVGTGTASGEHGFVGYSFEVPGVGLLNALRWCSQVDGGDLRGALSPADAQPLPTTFARASAAGVRASVVAPAKLADSALTRAVLSGGRYVGVHATGDLVAATLDALRPAPSFCYAYHGDLDLLGHLHGPGSPAWRMQLRQVDRLVESLIDGLGPDTLLAVVADHGMVTVDDTVIDADAEPALLDGVRLLGGEVRARHVYPEPGAEADVLAAWRETLGSRAWVLPRDEAVDLGWFGDTVTDRARERIGAVVAAARGRSGVTRELAEPQESSLVGQHGSLSDAEQFVPLALAYA